MRQIAIAALLLVLSGCTTYYAVRDPQNEKTYYTTDIDRQGGGAVRFRDGNTHSVVTLQNSTITKVTEDQYDAGTRR